MGGLVVVEPSKVVVIGSIRTVLVGSGLAMTRPSDLLQPSGRLSSDWTDETVSTLTV